MKSTAAIKVAIDALLIPVLDESNTNFASSLLEQGADIEQPDANTHNTLLHKFVLDGNEIAVEWLINNKANIDALNQKGNTPLLLAILKNQDSIAIKLLSNVANRAIKNNDKFDAVALTVLRDNILKANNTILLLLLDKEHADLPYLHLALARKDLPLLKALLEKKECDIEEKNSSGYTALHEATAQNNLEAVEILLAKGANPAASCNTQRTPLHQAVMNSNLGIMHIFLRCKININAEDMDGNTPLHLAAKLGRAHVIPLLLRKDVNFKLPNGHEKTPIELAEQEGRVGIRKLIIKTRYAIKQARKKLPEFLKYVVEGEQDKAEAMLIENRELVFCKGNVTDLSGRTFNNITGFQYAVWALDSHMWTMIQKYLIIEKEDIYAAYDQMKRLATGPWIQQHGTSASWQNLIDALILFIDMCNKRQWDAANKQWCVAVGNAQQKLPVHVINQYCHPNRSFSPYPNFEDQSPLPRTRETEKGEWFTCVYNGGRLGENCFAFVRAAGAWSQGRGSANNVEYVEHDHLACVAYLKHQIQLHEKLFSDLADVYKSAKDNAAAVSHNGPTAVTKTDEKFKQNINGQEVNESYQYEDNDVNAILRTRLTEIINKREYTGNPYRIQVLAAIDGMSPLALEDSIGENRANFPGEQTLLIPYNVGHYHWIGILLHFNADGQITKAQHMDSLGCHDFNLIQDRLNAANYNCTLKQLNLLQQHDGTSCGAYMVENLLLALQNKNILTMGLTCAEIRSNHLCSLQSLMPDFYAAFYQRQLSNSSSIVSLNSRLGYRKQDTAKPEEVKFTSFELKKILDICDNIQGFSNKTITAQLCNAFKNPCSNADTEHSIHLNAIRSAFSRIADELNITNATVQDSEQLAKLVNLLFCKEWKIGESLTEEFMDRLWVDYEQILAVGKLAFGDFATISKQLRQDIAKQITDDKQIALKLQAQFYQENSDLDIDTSRIERITRPIIFSQGTPIQKQKVTNTKDTQEVIKLKPVQAVPDAFLRLVTEGEQDEAELMLKKNRDLVLHAGNVTDLSGRTFENITGFQYAVWALDSHMWEMFRNHLSPEEVKIQIQGMDTGSWVTEHGKSASWQNLIDALDVFIDLTIRHKWLAANQQWCGAVGNAQQQLPMHVVNQYCNPNNSFYPCPNFSDQVSLQRNRKADKGDWFTCIHNGSTIGNDSFAFYRGDLGVACAEHAPAIIPMYRRMENGDVPIPQSDHRVCTLYLRHQTQLRDHLFAEVLGNQTECIQAKIKLNFALQ